MAWEDLTARQIELMKEDLRLIMIYAEANRTRVNGHDDEDAVAAAEFALVEFEAAHEHELPNVPTFLMKSRGFSLEEVEALISARK